MISEDTAKNVVFYFALIALVSLLILNLVKGSKEWFLPPAVGTGGFGFPMGDPNLRGYQSSFDTLNPNTGISLDGIPSSDMKPESNSGRAFDRSLSLQESVSKPLIPNTIPDFEFTRGDPNLRDLSPQLVPESEINNRNLRDQTIPLPVEPDMIGVADSNRVIIPKPSVRSRVRPISASPPVSVRTGIRKSDIRKISSPVQKTKVQIKKRK